MVALIVSILVFAAAATAARADDAKPAAKKDAIISGKAEVLRGVPKRFASLTRVDPARHKVTLLIEGESLAKVWSLTPDAEVKVQGWWGRLEQLPLNERVWVWFHLDRNKQPVSVLMLADELSEQDIHGPGVTVEARADGQVTLKPVLGDSRTLKVPGGEIVRGPSKAPLDSLKVGEKVYVQSRGDQARLILDPAAFEARRAEQKNALRQRWLDQGLPGTVLFLHISGESEVMLDHETMRWARALTPGDKVTLQTVPPIPAVLQQVRPWRERTQLRLVIAGADQADLAVGQRVAMKMAAPAAELEASSLPPDLDRPRTREERIEWALASIYCTCKVKGNGCTGHFYTLASCNPNTCGMPNRMRKLIAEKIDNGLTDKQLLEELLKEQGPDLFKQHLLP